MRSGEIRYLTPKEVESYQDWWIFLNEQPIAGDRFWHLTQMGKYVGFKYIRYFTFMDDLRYWEVKLGYRIGPYDADGYNAESNRWKYGTTPTFQILKFGTAGSDYD
jgi:hypothetical protein